MLRFPSGVVAQCVTSYDAHDKKDLSVQCEKAWFDLEDAFAYKGKTLKLSHRSGDLVTVETLKLGEQDQFALEIDHMARCVKENTEPKTPGEEVLRDQVIMEALYKSAETGAAVSLKPPTGL